MTLAVDLLLGLISGAAVFAFAMLGNRISVWLCGLVSARSKLRFIVLAGCFVAYLGWFAIFLEIFSMLSKDYMEVGFLVGLWSAIFVAVRYRLYRVVKFQAIDADRGIDD